MERANGESRRAGIPRAALVLLLAAFAAFAAANVLHNRFGLDPAIVPAAVFTALFIWKRRTWQLLAAAFFMAAPSLLFFKWAALTSPGRTISFLNHLFLLLAAVLAVAGAAFTALEARRTA